MQFVKLLPPTFEHHFKISGTVESIPDNAHPVTAFHDDDEFFTMYPYSLKSITPPTPKSLILKSSLIQGPDMAGSDGSVDVLRGHRACAYCVQLNGARYEGRQRYPNSPFATSYQAELEGCLNTIKMMQELPTLDGIDQYIDNSETVQHTINKVLPNKVLAPEADIILAIHHELNNNMTIRPDTKWAESHQDDHDLLENLLLNAQMNSSMNIASKSRNNDSIVYDTPYPGSDAMLIINGQWVTTRYSEQIRDALMANDHLQYFLHKYPDKSKKHYDSIYWHGIGLARRGLTNHQNINIFKLMNRWLNSGRQKGLFDQPSECVSCGWPEETILHMYQCNHPDAKRTRKQALIQLEKYYHHKIPSPIYVPIIKLIRSACRRGGIKYDFPSIPALLTAVTSQQALSDDFILRGYLTQDWISALLLYTRDKPDQKLNHIYLGIWTILFKAVWETRNTIKHGGNTIVHAHEREALLSDISEWRRNQYNCLSNGQQYLLDYFHEETQQWTNSH